MGGAGRRGSGGGGGWSSFSQRRKLRLIRTGAISLVLLVIFVWVVGRCGSDDTVAVTGSNTSTTVTSTEPPRAQLATATALQVALGGATYSGVPAVIDGKIYILGGLNEKKQSSKTIWLFDPLSNTVTEAGALTAPTHDPMGGAIGASAFAFGGGAGNKTFDKVEVFAAGATVATVSAKLPSPRTDGIAVSTPTRDSLFVIGGYDGKNPTNDVLGTSDGKTFAARAVLAQTVRYPAAEIAGNVIWVFGGEQNNQPTDLIQKIDLTTGEATVAGRLAAPMSHASAFTLGGTIFIAGGKSADGATDAIRRFDPTTISTVDAGVLPTTTTDAMVAVSGETAYLIGGLTPKASSGIVAITAK